MGKKRRAMHSDKFKHSRPNMWAIGRERRLTKLQQKLADTGQLKEQNTEELAKVDENRTENVPQINKIVTDVTEESKVELKTETETKTETVVTETPKPKAKRAPRKKTTAKATTETKAKAKPKTTRRRRTKKTAS